MLAAQEGRAGPGGSYGPRLFIAADKYYFIHCSTFLDFSENPVCRENSSEINSNAKIDINLIKIYFLDAKVIVGTLFNK